MTSLEREEMEAFGDKWLGPEDTNPPPIPALKMHRTVANVASYAGSGSGVSVDVCRPWREHGFYSIYIGKSRVVLRTGMGDGMATLAATIAKNIATGMLDVARESRQ